MSETKYKLMELPIGKIKPSLDNPRKTFNTERLKELVESIKSIDLMDEIVVRSTDNNHYEIINGERRWRAEREILGNEGLLKVRVYNVDAVTAQEMRLTELSQREDVDQIEVENAVYKYWVVRGKPEYSAIASKTGYSPTSIANFVNAGKDRFPQDDVTPPFQKESEPSEEVFDVSADDLKVLRRLKDKPKLYDALLKARAAGVVTQDELRNHVNEIIDLKDEVKPTDTLRTIKQKVKAQKQQEHEEPKPTGKNIRKPRPKKQQPKKKPALDSIKDKAPKIYEELKKSKSNGLLTKEREESLVKKVQEDPKVTSEDTLKDVTKREKVKEKPKQETPEPEWPEGLWEGYKKEQDEHKAWLETPEGRKRIEVSENAHRHLHLQNAIVEDTNDVHIFCPNCGKGKEFLGWMCCHTPADKAVEMAYEQHQKDIDEKGRKSTDP